MLNWPPSVRVFVSVLPTDLRRSFDSLAALVREVIGQDPLSGHAFVFFNRLRDRAKILVWDRTGYWLFYTRLEAGVFRLPNAASKTLELTPAELSLILEGIDLTGASRQQRYSLAAGRCG
jgi:transposase